MELATKTHNLCHKIQIYLIFSSHHCGAEHTYLIHIIPNLKHQADDRLEIITLQQL